MSFTPEDRALLAQLADALIPAGEGLPSAGEAGVAAEGLDQVLAARPDLEAGLKAVLERARSRRAQAPAGAFPAAEFAGELRKEDPAGFGVLAELTAGAYFLNSRVRDAYGYPGQTPRPIDPRPDYLDDGLLKSVLDRGPIYRPTPE